MHGNENHHWRVRSTHSTSEGTVRYETCACGRWRVSLRPIAQTRVLAGGQDRQTGAMSRR
jgi:hypothetical protein